MDAGQVPLKKGEVGLVFPSMAELADILLHVDESDHWKEFVRTGRQLDEEKNLDSESSDGASAGGVEDENDALEAELLCSARRNVRAVEAEAAEEAVDESDDEDEDNDAEDDDVVEEAAAATALLDLEVPRDQSRPALPPPPLVQLRDGMEVECTDADLTPAQPHRTEPAVAAPIDVLLQAAERKDAQHEAAERGAAERAEREAAERATARRGELEGLVHSVEDVMNLPIPAIIDVFLSPNKYHTATVVTTERIGTEEMHAMVQWDDGDTENTNLILSAPAQAVHWRRSLHESVPLLVRLGIKEKSFKAEEAYSKFMKGNTIHVTTPHDDAKPVGIFNFDSHIQSASRWAETPKGVEQQARQGECRRIRKLP
mmetsp:Transcript_23287/g.59465  ORF Transcript_23287/g.59465 Transcript_23287/m.59465 type:complete len:372 (+) Transcript_23287:368-1483(+)